MIKNILAVLLFATAFFVEETAGFHLWNVPLPLTLAVAILWFWKVPLGKRISLALAFGLFFDALHHAPFGTYLASFFLTAILAEFLQKNLSEINSAFTRSFAAAVLFFSFEVFLAFSLTFLGKFSGSSVSWPIESAFFVFLAVLFWSLALGSSSLFVLWLAKRA